MFNNMKSSHLHFKIHTRNIYDLEYFISRLYLKYGIAINQTG